MPAVDIPRSKGLEAHPAAKLFPMMGEEEIQALADDIRQNGQRHPIILYRGQILDGRNRYEACTLAGRAPLTVEWDGKGGSPTLFVLSLNLHRRHLTAGQRAILASDVADRLKEEGKERQRAAAAATNAKRQAASGPPDALPNRGQSVASGPLPETVDESGDDAGEPHRTSEVAAKQVGGVSRSYVEAASALKLASPELANEVREGKKTLPQAKRQIKQEQIKAKAAEVKAAAPKHLRIYRSMDELTWAVSGGDEKRFGCIYADPPWVYDNQGTQGATDNQYVTMSIDQIKAMPIRDIAADDSHLLLWATSTLLPEAMATLGAWGFTYNSFFVWDKSPRFGLGNRFRICSELLLVGTRGKSAPLWLRHDVPNVFRGGAAEHSAKPDDIRALVESCTVGPHVELFARKPAKGWAVMGNEIEVPQEATA
jgi:N6-adenosine-specific RNA methylase IME4